MELKQKIVIVCIMIALGATNSFGGYEDGGLKIAETESLNVEIGEDLFLKGSNIVGDNIVMQVDAEVIADDKVVESLNEIFEPLGLSVSDEENKQELRKGEEFVNASIGKIKDEATGEVFRVMVLEKEGVYGTTEANANEGSEIKFEGLKIVSAGALGDGGMSLRLIDKDQKIIFVSLPGEYMQKKSEDLTDYKKFVETHMDVGLGIDSLTEEEESALFSRYIVEEISKGIRNDIWINNSKDSVSDTWFMIKLVGQKGWWARGGSVRGIEQSDEGVMRMRHVVFGRTRPSDKSRDEKLREFEAWTNKQHGDTTKERGESHVGFEPSFKSPLVEVEREKTNEDWEVALKVEQKKAREKRQAEKKRALEELAFYEGPFYTTPLYRYSKFIRECVGAACGQVAKGRDYVGNKMDEAYDWAKDEIVDTFHKVRGESAKERLDRLKNSEQKPSEKFKDTSTVDTSKNGRKQPAKEPRVFKDDFAKPKTVATNKGKGSNQK